MVIKMTETWLYDRTVLATDLFKMKEKKKKQRYELYSHTVQVKFTNSFNSASIARKMISSSDFSKFLRTFINNIKVQ